MMAIQFLTPLVTTFLYVIVYQKAGFRGPMLLVAGAPILAALLTFLLIRMMGVYSMGLALLSIPLGLLPLFVLAFKSWPPVVAAQTGSRGSV